MAARSKVNEIVKEARCIAKKFGISVISGDHAGEAGCIPTSGDNITMTYESAIIRLMLLQIELLSNIRENESNP